MRLVGFIQAILYLIAFALVFFVILTDRSTQRLPAPRLAPASTRRTTTRGRTGAG